jgi:rhodanese-related sulfurtransferase
MRAIMLFGGLFSFGSKRTKDSPYTDPETLRELIHNENTSYHLVDCRSREEWLSGYIPTARHLPYSEITQLQAEASKDDLIIVYCESGGRSETAKKSLEQLGYTNVVNFGGVRDWQWELEYPDESS